MRNNPISRTDLGSNNPFALLKGDNQQEDELLNLENGGETTRKPIPPITPTPKPEDEEPINPPVEEEEEEVEDELPANAKVKVKTHIPKLMAERLKADGQLPDDYEVDEKTTGKDVENAYRKFMADKVREEERNLALEELKAEGYDDKVLKSAQKLHYGVTEQEISLQEGYSVLGTIEFDSSHDSYEANTKMLFQQYYLDKGLPADEAEVNANRDFSDSDDVSSLITNRQNYFANRAAEMQQAQDEQVKNAKLAEKSKKDNYIKQVNTFLEKGETDGIDGVKYSKSELELVRKSLFERTEVIVNEQGQRIRVTPYQKKKYERAKNDEQSFKDVVDFILGYDVKKIADKEKRKARKSIVDDFNDLIEVEVEVTSPKPTPKNDGGGDSIQRKSLG